MGQRFFLRFRQSTMFLPSGQAEKLNRKDKSAGLKETVELLRIY